MSLYRETMSDLIGKRVAGISINQDRTVLVFHTDQGDVAYEAEGDCCSSSWFNDLLGVDALLGGLVREVEEIGAPYPDGQDDSYESVVAYGHKITTDKGYADVVFRNASNGYYGGNLSLYPGLPQGVVPITADWTA